MNNTFSGHLLTVQQFVAYCKPDLIQQLRLDLKLALQEALSISERVINRLTAKFQGAPPQPVQVFRRTITIIANQETKKYRHLKEKNFGLSETAFNEMVQQLQANDEGLFEVIFLDHFHTCLNLLKNKYQAPQQDAYDATMNTMLIFCRRLKEGRIQYGNLRYLFNQVATHRYLNWVDRERKTTAFNQFDLIEEMPRYDDETYVILNQALARLGGTCQDLLKAFYYQEKTLQEVAEKSQRNYAAIRKQKQRCMEKLRACFQQLS